VAVDVPCKPFRAWAEGEVQAIRQAAQPIIQTMVRFSSCLCLLVCLSYLLCMFVSLFVAGGRGGGVGLFLD
jgi:hypothetical protein